MNLGMPFSIAASFPQRSIEPSTNAGQAASESVPATVARFSGNPRHFHSPGELQSDAKISSPSTCFGMVSDDT